MKRSKKLTRIAAAAEALCRGEEQRLAQERQRLVSVRVYAEKLSSLGGGTSMAVSLLPDIWCAQVSKTFSEIGRLDEEVNSLSRRLRLSKARRDNIAERLRIERSRERLAKHEKDVDAYLDVALLRRRIRLR